MDGTGGGRSAAMFKRIDGLSQRKAAERATRTTTSSAAAHRGCRQIARLALAVHMHELHEPASVHDCTPEPVRHMQACVLPDTPQTLWTREAPEFVGVG